MHYINALLYHGDGIHIQEFEKSVAFFQQGIFIIFLPTDQFFRDIPSIILFFGFQKF